MTLNEFKKNVALATEKTLEEKRKLSMTYFVEEDFMMAGIYLIILKDPNDLLVVAILHLARKQQTANLQMLLTEACRQDIELGKNAVRRLQKLPEDFLGFNRFTVTFEAVYESGLTKNDPSFTVEQIKMYEEKRLTGYAEKMRKRFAINMQILSEELADSIKEKRIADSIKK